MMRNSPLVHLPIVMMLLAGSFLSAQEPSVAPSAPLPAQIVGAKKVFISNGGEQRDFAGDLLFSGGPDRAYNQFYAAIKDWGRYELVATPADADLILQIHLADLRGGFFDELNLLVLDPRTNVTLWTFSEHAKLSGRQKTRDASLDSAISLLSDDLKKLASGSAVAATSGQSK